MFTLSPEEIALLVVPFFLLFVSIVKHAVRESIVAALLKLKNPLATEVSDWSTSGGYYVWAVKADFIWGEKSNQLLQVPDTAWAVSFLRFLLIIQYVLQITMAILFYIVFLSHRF